MRPYLNTLATACNESGLMGGELGVGDEERERSVTGSQLLDLESGVDVVVFQVVLFMCDASPKDPGLKLSQSGM